MYYQMTLFIIKKLSYSVYASESAILLTSFRPLESKLDKKDEENTESTRQFQMTQIGNPAMDNTEAESKGEVLYLCL